MNLLRSAAAVIAAILLGAAASPLPAQSETGKPQVTASLVPIGANSDAYWTGDGPGMRAIALDPDAAPPSTLCVRDRKGFKVIPGILNRPSIALSATDGLLRVFANQDSVEDQDPPLFGNFKIPSTPGHYDIFLNRAKARKGWDKPESMVLPSSTLVFQPDSFRLINLCDQPIKAKIGATAITLGPRRAKIIPMGAGGTGKLLPVQAVHAKGKELRFILRTGIRMEAGQRANLIFYPGREPKKPCLATWFYQAEPEVERDNKVLSSN